MQAGLFFDSHGRGHWFDPSTTHQIHGYVGSPKNKGPLAKAEGLFHLRSL